MIDIHNHILPGVDDGAENMEEAIEMAKSYLARGVDTIISTPHYIEAANSSNKAHNLRVLDSLRTELSKRNIDFKIYLGNEIYLVPNIVDFLKEGLAASLNNSRYVLVELPMREVPIYFMDSLYELQLEGYIPILAHPERNKRIQEDPSILKDVLDSGALAQLNLPSFLGVYGSPSKETADLFLRHGYYQFVATDSHGIGRRSPDVLDQLGELKSIVDEEEFERLIYGNPKKVLEDEEIEVGEVEDIKKTSLIDSIKNIFRR